MNSLEKLARVVHEAPEDFYCGYINEKGIQWGSSHTGYIERFFHASKKQILAERDRLSGKPTEWVNDWARWRAQDGDGFWVEYQEKPRVSEPEDWKVKDGELNVIYPKGEVLGDWRDTLEERVMEDFIHKEYGEVFKELAKKEQSKWNGEGLPPVGTTYKEAELFGLGYSNPKYEVVAHHYNGACVVVSVEVEGGVNYMPAKPCHFKPLKSEREQVIEKMVEVADKSIEEGVSVVHSITEALYDTFDIKLRGEGE